MSSLQSLSVDLHVLILQSLPSRKALSSAIRAVPQLYRAFTGYKNSVVSQILLNEIPPELGGEFITAFRAQGVWKYAPDRQCKLMCPGCESCCADIPELQRECNEITEQFQSGVNEGRLHELLAEHMQVMKAWKFFTLLDRLTITFCKMALPRLGRCSVLDYSERDQTTQYKLPSLSPSERARLLRAFIRCEIYVCASQDLMASDYETMSKDTPAARFLNELASWESEEVVCILHFYKALLEQLYDSVEDDFVSTAKRKDAIFRAKGTPRDAVYDPTDILEIYHLGIFTDFSKRRCHVRNIESLITCGAVAIGNLTTVPFQTARDIVLQTYVPFRFERSILQEAYCMANNYIRPSISRRPYFPYTSIGRRFEGESFKSPNFGWAWAIESQSHGPFVNDSSNYHLIRQGYVFWDKERMTALDMYSVRRGYVSSFSGTNMDEDARSGEPSVETRLKKGAVHWGVIQEMSDDIGREGIGRPVDWRNWDLIRV